MEINKNFKKKCETIKLRIKNSNTKKKMICPYSTLKNKRIFMLTKRIKTKAHCKTKGWHAHKKEYKLRYTHPQPLEHCKTKGLHAHKDKTN